VPVAALAHWFREQNAWGNGRRVSEVQGKGQNRGGYDEGGVS
jgi:hypothetical protein